MQGWPDVGCRAITGQITSDNLNRVNLTGKSQMSPDFGHKKGTSEIDRGTFEIDHSILFGQKGHLRFTGQSHMSLH